MYNVNAYKTLEIFRQATSVTLAIEEFMLVLVNAGKISLFGMELLLLPLGSKESKNRSVTTA